MDEEAFLFQVYEQLPQAGPGSDASTRRAWQRITGLPARPVAADFGCGPGRSSLLLARATGGRVIALDKHEPFIAALSERVHRAGLSRHLLPVVGDMARPPLAAESLDLIWSEGAVYFLGFAQGLRQWRPLLKAGGCIAVTELTWLTERPSAAVLEFWQTAYPPLRSIAANVEALEQAGYDPIDTFILPAEDWLIHFHRPLQAALQALSAAHPSDPLAQKVVAAEQAEIDLYREHGAQYGYVFYIARTR
jgi:SAM-dependent methyltransferase